MSEQVPLWIANLALDIYKIIQQYDAITHFQEMVKKWTEDHQAEIENHTKWQEKRDQHFEQAAGKNTHLQDKDAGSPEKDWEWETLVIHTYEKTETGLQRIGKIISAWVPPELSLSAKPEITQLLPLSREHELTLAEKYTVLAAIYDYGRKGTAKLPPWQWPDISLELSEEALSNAKKCLFFECLCRSASEINSNDEGWLRAILDDIEKDVSNLSGVKQPEPQKSENIETIPSETRVDRWIKKAKNHPLISIIIIACVVIFAVGTLVTKIGDIIAFWDRMTHKQPISQKDSQNIMDTRILTGTATVEITITSDKKGKTNHIIPGTYLAFAKGREALIVMSSKESISEQVGKNSVRYSSKMSIETTDQGLNQPLSLLKQAEYIQICLKPIPAKSHILSGKALCVFNGNIPMEIQIPSQEMSSNIITIRDFDVAFSKIR